MKIELKEIIIENLFDGFADNAEAGVVAYGGKLDIRPPYQREFIYKDKQRDAVIDSVRKAMRYSECPDRFLFGSDWPLAPVNVHRDFIRELVPEEFHQAVFYDNAKKLFS